MRGISRNRFDSVSSSIIQFYLDTIDFPKSARHNVSFDEANLAAQPAGHTVPIKSFYVNLPTSEGKPNANGNFSFIEPMADKSIFDDASLSKDLDRTVYTTTYEDNNGRTY